jgi:rRNA maturation endonuclease Nob1
MSRIALFVMGLFGRLRHQCEGCRKTFYRTQIIDEYGQVDVCPHCGCSSYIVV